MFAGWKTPPDRYLPAKFKASRKNSLEKQWAMRPGDHRNEFNIPLDDEPLESIGHTISDPEALEEAEAIMPPHDRLRTLAAESPDDWE